MTADEGSDRLISYMQSHDFRHAKQVSSLAGEYQIHPNHVPKTNSQLLHDIGISPRLREKIPLDAQQAEARLLIEGKLPYSCIGRPDDNALATKLAQFRQYLDEHALSDAPSLQLHVYRYGFEFHDARIQRNSQNDARYDVVVGRIDEKIAGVHVGLNLLRRLVREQKKRQVALATAGGYS
jgi:hypothetical protein